MKSIILLNERIIDAIFSLRETMAKNQTSPDNDPEYINAISKWYYSEGSQIEITLCILEILCFFSWKTKINRDSYNLLRNVVKTLKSLKEGGTSDLKQLDNVEKSVLPQIKKIPPAGVIKDKT
jgi:hypothetical protein